MVQSSGGHSIERYRFHLEIICDQQVVGLGLVDYLEHAELITKHAGKSGGLLDGFSGAYQSVSRRFSCIFNDPALRPVKRDRLAAALISGVSASLQPH